MRSDTTKKILSETSDETKDKAKAYANSLVAKQKAIKQAYVDCFIQSGMTQQEAEEKWNKIECKLDDNYWLERTFTPKLKIDLNIFDERFNPNWRLTKYRPKTLRDIETNRNWESVEDGFPNEHNTYFVCDINQKGRVDIFTGNLNALNGNYTHWQPMTKPDLPIF